ncbi:hypothetical protein F4808DRAFT_412596 [Astrocystis sublimbata]|nr:hypothetical protein F4808DRAFT_412596 [Astrocystis sublimbata]
MPGLIQEPIAGCIKWLPRKENLEPADPNIEEGCCNHPVVILSKRPQDERVQFLVITSLGGDDLVAKFPTQRGARHSHLPIAPCDTHPDNGILLVLKYPTDKMRKKSYVKTKQRRSILLRSLEPYNRRGPEIFLSTKSYQVLVKHAGFVEPQEAPVLYGLSTGRTFQSAVRSPSHEHTIDIGRIGSVDPYGFTTRDYFGTAAQVSYYTQPPLTSPAIGNYTSRPLPSTNSISAVRQPLLANREVYRPSSYESYTSLPTTHPISPAGGSDPSGAWKIIKVLFYIFLALVASYGLYRAGHWAVVSGSRALSSIKTSPISVCQGGAEGLWESILQMTGIKKQEVSNVSARSFTDNFRLELNVF